MIKYNKDLFRVQNLGRITELENIVNPVSGLKSVMTEQVKDHLTNNPMNSNSSI